MEQQKVKEEVRTKYGEAARRVATGQSAGCGCGTSDAASCDPITSNLYATDETAGLPDAANFRFLLSLNLRSIV